MSIYHIIIDKGEDYPDDGQDRYDHIVFGKGDDILEYTVDHDAHYRSKESLETDLAFMRQVEAQCGVDGINVPERFATELESLDIENEEWEDPGPPPPRLTSLCYSWYQQPIEPGTTLKKALKQIKAWDVPDGVTWYKGGKPVGLDYVFQAEDKIEGFRRQAEKGTQS